MWRASGASRSLPILGALAAGLAAAWGRELEAGRPAGWRWLLRRLLVLPLLAIASAVAAEAFGLSATFAGFTAAMLSLGGYDALRLIEGKWNRRFEQASDRLAGEEGAQPGER